MKGFGRLCHRIIKNKYRGALHVSYSSYWCWCFDFLNNTCLLLLLNEWIIIGIDVLIFYHWWVRVEVSHLTIILTNTMTIPM